MSSHDIPFEILTLDHVVLNVTDMARSVRFYCNALGARIEREIEDVGMVQLRLGASLVDLLPAEALGVAEVSDHNMDHFCLRIAPFDEAAIRAHLEAQGIDVPEPARRYGADGFGPSIYIEDPDGNIVELKGPPDGA